MKVELSELRLGISAVVEEAQVGIMDKKRPNVWKHKIEIHNDFIHAVVTKWKNKKEVFIQGDYQYEVSVKVTKVEPKKVKKVKSKKTT